MPIRTKLTELLKIEHPIVQGGMHHVGLAPLAAAVSNAGGLGVITSITVTMSDPKDPLGALRREIQKCRSLTSKPFGVNLTLLPVGGKVDIEGIIRTIIEEKVPVVETAGRNPEKAIKVLKANGIVVMHKCTSIRHALTAQRQGADVISMDGFDCGGHPGEDDVGNWVLLPKAARKLRIPFIASGGCADGKQLAAALALGAVGMNMGTRFMAVKEAPIKDGIKQALVDADERSTTHVLRSLKNTERVFKNPIVTQVQKLEKEFPGDITKIYPLIKGDNYKKSFQVTGNPQDSVWSCGQSLGLIDDVPTCDKLLKDIVSEAEVILARGPSYVISSKL
jgi:NAD(P)H-dependent flavin oxidoreductase YrpB (nitropropane dioxygenase family)